MNIAVMGVGAAGGYLGGLIARGAHLNAIRGHGLRVISANDGDFTVPGSATHGPTRAGPRQLVLFTVKPGGLPRRPGRPV